METKYNKLMNLQAQAEKIFSDVAREDRDLNADERTELKRLHDEGVELNKEILKSKADAEMHDEIKNWNVTGEVEVKSNRMSDKLFKNDSYKQWFKSIAPTGNIPDSRKGINSPSFDMKDFGLFTKSIITGGSDTSAGAFIQNDATGIYAPIGYAPRVARDLISIRQTTSDTVEFVRQTTKSNSAAVVAEATDTPNSGKKPESTVGYAKVTVPVDTIAVWIPATKAAMSYASQMRGLIDQELKADLMDELETQIFTKLADDANILTSAYATDLFTTTRKALTKIKTTGLANPTSWVMNPADWEKIELSKNGDNGTFYYGGPVTAGNPRLWGVPVVESAHVAEGTAYLADWSKAVLWDRQQAFVSISDSHDDFFTRNLVAILAEMRAAFAVTRPNSFVKVALTS